MQNTLFIPTAPDMFNKAMTHASKAHAMCNLIAPIYPAVMQLPCAPDHLNLPMPQSTFGLMISPLDYTRAFRNTHMLNDIYAIWLGPLRENIHGLVAVVQLTSLGHAQVAPANTFARWSICPYGQAVQSGHIHIDGAPSVDLNLI